MLARRALALVSTGVVLAAVLSSRSSAQVDRRVDAGVRRAVGVDAGVDAGVDTGADAGVDAALDRSRAVAFRGADAGIGPRRDAGIDAAVAPPLGGTSRSGVSLRTGFIPDPLLLQGQAFADQPMSALSADCLTGFVGRAPSHVVSLDTRFGFLRIYATGTEDLVLAVRDADGQVVCSDDRFGMHPGLEGRFSPGPIEIWVGVQSVELAPALYQLRLTETRSMRPGANASGNLETDGASLGAEIGLDVTAAEGRDEAIRLRRGFLPDPRFLAGHVEPAGDGGSLIDLSQLGGGCRGFVTAQPNHVVTLREEFDWLQLYLPAMDENLTIVLLGPDGGLGCAASDEGRVGISRPRWMAGEYRVWLGAHREDAALPYQLGVSELRHVHEEDE